MERDIQLIVVVIIHFYILLDNQSNPVTFLFISINKNLYITSENVLTIPHLAAFALLLHQKAGPSVHGLLPTKCGFIDVCELTAKELFYDL